jgi:ABC-2 type transport system ATP-binding protein
VTQPSGSGPGDLDTIRQILFAAEVARIERDMAADRRAAQEHAADLERRIGQRMDELAADLQIAEFLDRQTGKLSAGQKTRVALAKALLNAPELLLLDEPTASLDPDTGDWVRGYLERYQLQSGATILLASHNMLEVERLCSEVMMMRRGRIVDRGSPRALIERYGRDTLEEVFLHIVRSGEAGAREAAQ